VRLWKETVNLETSPADARVLLSRAVEVIPLSVELWLALARLETPENAKAVLNKARKAVPTSHEIWIAAGRLIEQEAYAADLSEEKRTEELERVDKTLSTAVRALRAHGVLLTREQWLKEAERCEGEGAPRTCEAIVSATVAMDVEEEDRLATWLGDAEAAEARGRVGTARSVLAYALRVFPDRRDLWRRAADLEKAHGTHESLDKLLARAVECCPQAEVLWLMWAKEKWLGGDVPAAREVLERAFVRNSESEQIWLAAVKLEAENGELRVARELLVRARTVADTERVTISTSLDEYTGSYFFIILFPDLDEISRIRASARPNRTRSDNGLHCVIKISEVCQTVHDPRANSPSRQQLFCCTRCLCRRAQGYPEGYHPVGPRQPTRGSGWKEHPRACIAGESTAGQPEE
jgi:pre-mRNA-processing factor 6